MTVETKLGEDTERRRRALVTAIKEQTDSDFRDACEELFNEMEQDGTLEEELKKPYAVATFFQEATERLRKRFS